MKPRVLLLILVLALVAGAVPALRVLFPGSQSESEPRGISRYVEILSSSPEIPQTAIDRAALRNVRLVNRRARFSDTQLASQDRHLWLVSTPGLLCVADPRGAACAAKSVAINRGVVLGTFQPPSSNQPKIHNFLLQGVVSNDVDKVLVVIGDHQQLTIPVRQNVFSVERDKPVHLMRLLRN